MRPAPPDGSRPAVGQLRLELLAEIAVGSTTRVDLCRSRGPLAPGDLLAVKRLLPELLHDPVLSQRFLDEVWMTSALHHPNVVRVIGWGTDDRGSYLAVELVQGVSLARLMKTVFETGEDFTERLAVYLGLCVARGLGAAHDLRSDRGDSLMLVHRNLTPANVLLGFQGDVKIADFGLAKAKQRLSTTTASSLPNRPSTHVSPEEVRGESVDRRSDLFSLGVILYEVLTRKLPFTGVNDLETVQRIVRDEPADLLSLRPKLDRNLARTVIRCLEKDPQKRFQTAGEVARELEGWLFAHGWQEENEVTLGRFVRRNAMRQMHWFERAIAGGAREATQRPPPGFLSTSAPAVARPPPPEKNRAEVTAVEKPVRRRRADSAPPSAAPPSAAGAGRSGSERPPSVRPSAPPRSGSAHFDEIETLKANVGGPRAAAELADPPTVYDEDSEEIPTVAMKRDDLPAELLARLRAAKGALPSSPGATSPPRTTSGPPSSPPGVPRPAVRSKPPPLPTPPAPPAASSASPAPGAPSGDTGSGPRPITERSTEWSRAIDRIRLEIETHGTAAASMRESAQQLLAAADDEESARRRAEQGLAMAKDAAALAGTGATAEARARLEEALRLAGVQKR